MPSTAAPSAIETSSARPSEPPSSREVSTAPLASPDSPSRTPASAASGVAISASPEAEADDGVAGHEVRQVVGLLGHAGEQGIPAAMISNPIPIVGAAPIRFTHRGATCAAMKSDTNAIGNVAAPDASGE